MWKLWTIYNTHLLVWRQIVERLVLTKQMHYLHKFKLLLNHTRSQNGKNLYITTSSTGFATLFPKNYILMQLTFMRWHFYSDCNHFMIMLWCNLFFLTNETSYLLKESMSRGGDWGEWRTYYVQHWQTIDFTPCLELFVRLCLGNKSTLVIVRERLHFCL